MNRITELNRRKEKILSELQAIDVELDELSASYPSMRLMRATVRVDGEEDQTDGIFVRESADEYRRLGYMGVGAKPYRRGSAIFSSVVGLVTVPAFEWYDFTKKYYRWSSEGGSRAYFSDMTDSVARLYVASTYVSD